MIDKLLEYAMIPDTPVESFICESWRNVEQKLELIFPSDYKILISTYGSGQFFGFISFFNPFSINGNINLLNQITLISEQYKTLKDGGEVIGYSFFPEKDGLFAIAQTDNGDTIFFLTNNDPVRWKIVVNEARGDDWEEFDMSISDFLTGIIERSLVCGVFPYLSLERPLFTNH